MKISAIKIGDIPYLLLKLVTKRRRRATLAGIAVMLGLVLAACSGTNSVDQDKDVTDKQLQKYQSVQPVPFFDWSQYRQTSLDVLNAQVHGVATTTFFFNQGTDTPIKACPSIGFPLPSTAQLTNPDQYLYSSSGAVVAQAEPNGVYTGDSQGTYVVCVSSGGTKYVTYWEGNVQTEGGPAHWDKSQGMIVLDGDPTVKSGDKPR